MADDKIVDLTKARKPDTSAAKAAWEEIKARIDGEFELNGQVDGLLVLYVPKDSPWATSYEFFLGPEPSHSHALLTGTLMVLDELKDTIREIGDMFNDE